MTRRYRVIAVVVSGLICLPLALIAFGLWGVLMIAMPFGYLAWAIAADEE